MLEITDGYKASLDVKEVEKLRVAVVQARMHPAVTNSIARSCHDELLRIGVLTRNIVALEVPTVAELAFTAQFVAESKDVDVVVVIGSITRGKTLHFEWLGKDCFDTISRLSLELGLPIINAVLATDTRKQAQELSVDKGTAVAVAAVEMALLVKELRANSEFVQND